MNKCLITWLAAGYRTFRRLAAVAVAAILITEFDTARDPNFVTKPREQFQPLVPGKRLVADWFAGSIPANIEVGENVAIDSSSCFRHYFSKLPVGLRIGRNVTIWQASLAAGPDALIEIGDDCYLANASLVCSKSIKIGSRVMLASGVSIADSDFHPIEAAARVADTIAVSPLGNRDRRPSVESSPVVIGDDVWIGFNATVLKGVRIGRGAVIEPGAMIVKDVPAGARISGNPARVVSGNTT